jgi:uroporphyrinogen-III synthase
MNRFLQDKVFISTRPKSESKELAELFTDAGVTLLEFPMIQIQAAPLSENEKEYFKGLTEFQWLVFTSPNGVRYFFKNLKEIQSNTNLPETLQIAVIGNKTEKTLNEFGFSASFKNPGSTGEDFAEYFIQEIKKDDKQPNILLSLGNIARTVIQDKLTEFANCTRINVYQTTKPESFDKQVLKQIENNNYALLIFTSPSGINNFLSLSYSLQKENIRIACIGRTTANEARKDNITPKVIATKSTTLGLFESVSNYYKNIKKL